MLHDGMMALAIEINLLIYLHPIDVFDGVVLLN